SGSGTLVTGGKIVNGRKSPPESEVTKVLNGPSCSGMAVGADIVKKVVKTGDIIIIPAMVPHGWTDITDHVDYLSFRPSARVLGAAWGIVVDGELAHAGTMGFRDVASKSPVTADTVFRIASMTKSFTAMSILKLRDEGKLALDDPAEKYMPELRALKYPTSDS